MSLASSFIALGSNLRDREAQVRAGFEALAMLPQTRLARVSSLYRSGPVGYLDQPDFINAVAEIETALRPHALLDELFKIERGAGRVRDFPNAPRTLDLDLLLYEDFVCEEPALTLPHPRMHERAFVLAPLAEIAPQLEIPGRGPVATLLARVDIGSVTRISTTDE
ncbi:MAG TPA: 2-amino-4-hydroxy-6-hydroxymethyldihydropteridine diphosphokinase [Burkholderiales bacterium]|nr:2-amino-4-hydroxy-6-hydroxymethyldihydropteridine diphosphokinase [Burkholderiales bacterium]